MQNGVIVMNNGELKKFTQLIMGELDLSGGKIPKLIQSIAPKCNYNKQKIKVQVRRALIG